METNKLNAVARMSPPMLETFYKQNELAKEAFSTDVTYTEMRENYINERKYWNEGGPEPERVLNKEIDGPHGLLDIRFHYPRKRTGKGAIVYIHGGGFVVGNLDTHSKIMRLLMEETESVVIGIDYHLAPEHKYPVQIEECAFLLEWLRKYADEYDIDQDNIAIAGDSGGANLALATSLYLRDQQKDISFLRCLLLYYGSYGLTDSKSRRLYGGNYDGLSQKDLTTYSNLYIGNRHPDLRYFDCFSNDLTKDVPPCYIACGQLDPLLDDSLLLYDLLVNNNIKAEYDEFSGVIHAFLHFSRSLPVAIKAIQNGANFYKSSVKVT
ncbi:MULTISPECIES: alpha/beta hydrolase fold domain-containing protein [Sporosarcina]|uniref:Acetyl esterase n=1 Tax=Sporosarcina newyorkensis TaxID=759851 RepID=A0A1T4YI12_9BACL|nr:MULTISPECIES: alpha/beta hydrolase fold domain-containing protein [Sporosarcina]MBY0221817.1 alpha/beta hydrolase fold domain-containing protein [Sporosarcina aquimarina]SKB01426.1 acetyl esterase [Sporosarcina newyorkensis]